MSLTRRDCCVTRVIGDMDGVDNSSIGSSHDANYHPNDINDVTMSSRRSIESGFEPLSDSCGESDMDGLDLSLFEPHGDSGSWCDARVHAGTLYLLTRYCNSSGKS